MDEAGREKLIEITLSAYEVLGQLFVSGPTWDGHLVSKEGRGRLVNNGLADRLNG